jgi:chromosome segregation ATPase
LHVEELEDRSLPSVTGPLPAAHLPLRPALDQIANLVSALDRAETTVDTDVTRQQRDQLDLMRDRAELTALRTLAAQVHADDLAEGAWLAGQINQFQSDIALKQHDLEWVDVGLTADRGRLAQAEAAVDRLQTGLFAWPALYRTVVLLRSDIVSRDQLQADLDRAHADINRDLADLRQDQADLAADLTRGHHLPAVQADLHADVTDLQQDRNEVDADSARANEIWQQLYDAQNAVASDWRALLMAYITR